MEMGGGAKNNNFQFFLHPTTASDFLSINGMFEM